MRYHPFENTYLLMKLFTPPHYLSVNKIVTLMFAGLAATAAFAQGPTKAIVKPSQPVTGNKKALIILADFPDRPFTVGDTNEWVNSLANEEGYSEGRYAGSVKDYFKSQSRGLLHLDFDVTGPYRMPKKQTYYGEKNAIRPDAHIGEMIVTACRMADSDVNFADYDWDGNGELEMVFVLYSGYGEHVSNNTSLIWPKQATLTLSDYGEPLELDGVVIDTFACSCELNGKEGSEPTGIAAICHEYSHCFGLPDLYDKYGLAYGAGPWSLMDRGMYLDDGYTPCGYSAYERWYSGWMEPTELSEPVSVRGMNPLEAGGEAYVIYNDGNRNEFFVLENRGKTGWDAALPSEGLLIWHVDYDATEWRFNSTNSDDRHLRCYVVAADCRRNDETAAGDIYPRRDNTEFTDTSYPPSTLYNPNADGSLKLGKPVTGICLNPDGTVDFDFMGGDSGVAAEEISGPHITDIRHLDGRLLWRGNSENPIPGVKGPGVVLVRYSDGIVKKQLLSQHCSLSH